MKDSTTNDRNSLMTVSALSTIVGIWWVLSFFYPPIILPSPVETVSKAYQLAVEGQLMKELAITIQRVVIGFSFSLFIGTMLGCFIGSYENLYKFFKPMVTFLQTVPPISWILLAIIWMGFGSGAPIFVVIIATFPIFFFNSVQGVRNLPEHLIEMGNTFRVQRFRMIKDIYLPALWPFISSAITICIGSSWKTIVMAELLSSNNGVGAALSLARLQLETAEVFAWTLVVVVLGLTTEHIFQWFNDQTRVGKVRKWKSGA
ncbi:ABC transporter permease [Anaerobacillus sp. MEB173]|uniref:ABC transporter permease n=1 Tax=Anaerobacillus sp. MEB173 TaxID=3383345 RepID=UPI003F93A788